jgi:hypothetical protein
MLHRTLRSVWYTFVCLICLTAMRQPAQAGPPLICHPYEIGNAQSLPWSNPSEWRAVKGDYDLNRLVNDTLALLVPGTPVIVRMETLRRATVYAVWAARDREVGYQVKGQKIADELLARLMTRVQETAGKGKTDALALFDAGYLLAGYRQSGWQGNQHATVDAYAMVRKAAELAGDATMEFAAALATRDKAAQRAHLQKAVAGAPEGSLLARNLVSHFGDRGWNLAELRASVGAIQH